MSGKPAAGQGAQPIALVLVAAVGENGVIGQGNALPWRLKSDMQHVRALTVDKPVVMGRKTFQSIGKPLTQRTNIVVSRDPNFAPPGVLVATDLTAALALARDDARRRGANEIVVIGGSGIFADTLPDADRLEITHVHASPPGEVYFPAIDANIWRETAREERRQGPEDSAAFAVVTYQRRANAAA